MGGGRLTGQAAAAEQMLERSLAQEAQLEEEGGAGGQQARAVVQHNLARARAAMGRDPEPPGMMLQGFLLAKVRPQGEEN